MRTSIRITDEMLAEITAATADGAKHLIWCANDIVAADGTVVARHRKQPYVRRTPAKTKAKLLKTSRPKLLSR